MNIKRDENLPHQLVQLLTDLGHDVDTVPDEHLAGRDDGVVWAAAQTAGRFLVTQDLDFSDARKYAPGTHQGLLLVRLPQPGRSALVERVSTLFRTEAVETPVEKWRAASSQPLPGRCASSGQSDVCRWSSLQSTVILVLQQRSRCSDLCSGAATTLSAPIRESEDWQVRLRSGVRERVGARHL